MSYTTPETGMFPRYSLMEMQVNCMGSFQGNAAASPLAAQVRGYHSATPTWISTGLYQVQLIFPPTQAISTATTASSNTGCNQEPRAWIVSESETAQTAPAALTIIQTSRMTNAGVFYIWVYSATIGAGSTVALYNLTSADRLFYEWGWKATGFAP